MFYVFGINGPMYRGGPERLSQIAPVRRVQRPAALESATGELGANGASEQIPFPSTETTLRRAPNQGVVSAYASTAAGPKTARQPLRLVGDVMTRGAITVPDHTTVRAAWQQLSAQRVSQAPVLNDAQHVVGLLVRSDMVPLELVAASNGRDAAAFGQRSVAEVMLTPIPTVAESTDLRRVATVLLDTGLPGLPVTDDEGHLAGFISRTDLLKAIASDPPLDLWS